MLYGCIYGRGSLGVKVGGPSERTRPRGPSAERARPGRGIGETRAALFFSAVFPSLVVLGEWIFCGYLRVLLLVLFGV